MNKLIVFEGACDGIGKSTQYELLKNHVFNDGKIVKSHHFPSYGTWHGKPVERYLKGEFGTPSTLSAEFVHSLYAFDRSVVWNTQLKPAYDKGDVIILDRYTTSSLIYQGACLPTDEEKKKFIDYAVHYEYDVLGIKEPDQVLFLHAPFDLVTEMRKKRTNNEGIDNDIYERDISLMKKIYETSLLTATYLNWDIIECSECSKMRSIDDIHNEIRILVKK